MRTCIPDYFDEFHCLAGVCPDTCCGQWEIVVDPAAKARYLAVEGPLGEKIRAALTQVDGEDCMVLDHGRCPLLTEQGLCPIVTELGEEFLSTTCHTHPRFTEIYGGYQETMLSVSCPEAARLLLTRKTPLTFEIRTDDTPPEPTDLDADLFFTLLAGREAAFDLAQDRTRPLSDRLALLLCFARRLDGCLDRPRTAQALTELYREREYQDRQLVRIARLRRWGALTDVRQLLEAMEHLSADFPAQLTQLEKPDLTQDAIALEQLTVYFLFRWWLKAACNGYLWRQAAAAVVSVLAVAALRRTMGDVTRAARLYSKEVEHSEENMDLLRRSMELPYFTRNQLLRILEVPHAI